MPIKISSPLYPFLLAAFYPIKFLNDNAKFFNFIDIFLIEIILITTSFCIFVFLKKIYKSSNRAAVLTFFFGLSLGGIAMTGNASLVWLFTTAIIALALLRWRPPEALNVFANIFCFYLIGYLLFQLFTNQDFQKNPIAENTSAVYQSAESEFNDLNVQAVQDSKPSILHIVLDGYSGESSLKENYHYDNSSFVRELENRGFVILKNTHSPYNQTLPTLSAIFLGRYWDTDGREFSGNNNAIRRHWGQLTTQGPLHSKLKDAGYSLLFTDSGYPYLEPAPDAVFLKPKTGRDLINDFTYHYTLRTIVGAWLEKSLASDSISRHRDLLVNAFSHSQYRKAKKPFFLYQHVLSPHPPFIFDHEGNTTNQFSAFLTTGDGNHATGLIPEKIEQYKQGYINKLKVTNQLLLAQLEQLFQTQPDDLIIIIQGDHGGGAHLDQNSSENTCLTDRFSPFFAVYSTNASITQTFSNYKDRPYNIVNTYRIILGGIFDEDLAPLEDRSWFIPWNNLSGIHPVNLMQDTHCEQ